MNTLLAAIGIGLLVIVSSAASAGAGGAHDKSCAREVRALGDWGKTLNPGNSVFVSGTEGDDVVDLIAPGTVYCGLGGNDVVKVNNGWFYGGEGIDTVGMNEGVADGGDDTDVVMTNNGTFRGQRGTDIVLVNNGHFDGGPGPDRVQDLNRGTCIDVEEGC